MLRIGIDVQANELVTTNENDRAHLVFHDGSSLTANARLTIDRFVLDPSTKTGKLAITPAGACCPWSASRSSFWLWMLWCLPCPSPL